MSKIPILALTLLALLPLVPAHASSLPQTSTETISFDGFTVNVTHSFVVNTTARTLTGTSTVTVVNSTSGATLLSKTFSISLTFATSNTIKLILAVAPSSLNLAVSCNITIGSIPAAVCTVTRDPDINHNGFVDIIDAGVVFAAFGSSTGSPQYNPAYDLDADGRITVIDAGIMQADFGTPVLF
jgi:dockerin type I repeat protein